MNDTWNKLRLSALCEVFTDGDWIETKHQSSNGIRLIQTGNIGIGNFKNRKDKARYISNSTLKKLNCTEIFEDDCLVSRLPDPVGRACIIPDINERMITAVDCTIIRFNKNKIIPIYFNYFSQSLTYLSDIDTKITGATRKRISRKNLGDIIISFPPIPEQKHIVKILDEAFAVIEKAKANAEKNLQNSRELFDSYLNKVFANPREDWDEKKLEEIYDVRDGTHDSPKYQPEGYALITSKNLNREGLNFDKAKYISQTDYININKRSEVHKGDVLFAMIGTIGNPIVIEVDPKFAIKNVALFKVPPEQDSYFLKYYLESDVAVAKMISEAKGTTQKFVGLGYLRNFPIFVPRIDEQKTIVKNLKVLSDKTNELEHIYQQKLADLEELKKSILQKAFDGQL